MSKLNKYSKKDIRKEYEDSAVINFMGGTSYKLNPLDTLKIVATSSIFGEPSYYRSSSVSNRRRCNDKYTLFNDDIYSMTTEELFETTIDAALDFDFEGTLQFAVDLRETYLMRLNPSVIFVRAIMHEKRGDFTTKYPSYMSEIAKDIVNIPSDLQNMFEYYMFKNGTKKRMPSILKRVIAKNLSDFSKYHIAKYKNSTMIDMVRISHANSEVIDELMRTGTVKVEGSEQTWEKLRSEGKSWDEILDTINVPHMALLRNLRNIFSSENGVSKAKRDEILEKLEAGVKTGKQFPFRYYTAYNVVQNESVDFTKKIKNSLENCMDISLENFPKLKGRTMCLSDNSGSAHGTFTSEYGSVKVADIANLSSVMTAMNSDEGYVGCFGDGLNVHKIKKDKGILKQHSKLDTNVGMSTENGIWMFLDKAIKEKEHWDNIFIYSDMQAGHGQLYGKNASQYKEYQTNGRYIDVLKMIDDYRKKVNPKVNVFSVQVAGYDNSVIPENLYRGAVLSGWTGKEVLYASKIIDFWDEKEK